MSNRQIAKTRLRITINHYVDPTSRNSSITTLTELQRQTNAFHTKLTVRPSTKLSEEDKRIQENVGVWRRILYTLRNPRQSAAHIGRSGGAKGLVGREIISNVLT